MPSISESTKITIPVVVALITLAVWLAEVHFQGIANAQSVSEIQTRQERLESMQTDIAVIREQVSTMSKRLERMDQ